MNLARSITFMERLASEKISKLIRPPLIFSTDDKVSALIGKLRRSGAYEAVIESRSKPRLITLLDLLKASDPERTLIGKIARSAVPINFEAPILEAADLMIMNEAWCLIAKRNEEVLGVISQLDILSALSKHHLLQDISCEEIMRSEPPCVSAEDKLSFLSSSGKRWKPRWRIVYQGSGLQPDSAQREGYEG